MHDLHLVDNLLADDLPKEVMKAGYGRGLVEAGRRNNNVVAVSSDVVSSTGTNAFSEAFPERFIEIGVAEQNLVTVGSGLAAMGKIPFVAAYAAFSPGRNWEQIKTTICINDRPVKLISTHVGISDSPDGATHQMLEDIPMMRTLSNMVVIAPCDSIEAYKATLLMAETSKPAYMRIARDETTIFTTNDTPFEIGKAYVYWQGSDITIIGTGRMTYYCLLAAGELAKHGIKAEVIHCPTIKPLDSQTILDSVGKTRLVITAEEGQVAGGLGGAVAELLSEELPTKMKRIGIEDRFGESGSPAELFDLFKLTPANIVATAKELLNSAS